MSKRIVIVGGSGLIGRSLAVSLVARGDQVVALSRNPRRTISRLPAGVEVAPWSPADVARLTSVLNGADAVVNLAGVPVGPWPWTRGRRRAIRESRLGSTDAIVRAIAALPSARRPRVLVNASGTDRYEGQDATTVDESAPHTHNFLADVCGEWEAAAQRAADHGVRVAIVRMGFVIARGGATLRLFALPFRLGLGGPLGSGRQWMSWIHIDDVVGLVQLAIDDDRVHGPINAVSPEPALEVDVAAAIGAVLHRPSWLPVASWLIRLAMGESSILALGSRRIRPTRALAFGYVFRWTDLRAAVEDVLR